MCDKHRAMKLTDIRTFIAGNPAPGIVTSTTFLSDSVRRQVLVGIRQSILPGLSTISMVSGALTTRAKIGHKQAYGLWEALMT